MKLQCNPRAHVAPVRLPPWGGSGLKYGGGTTEHFDPMSPSLGREWIEIESKRIPYIRLAVSLLGEGVD